MVFTLKRAALLYQKASEMTKLKECFYLLSLVNNELGNAKERDVYAGKFCVLQREKERSTKFLSILLTAWDEKEEEKRKEIISKLTISLKDL